MDSEQVHIKQTEYEAMIEEFNSKANPIKGILLGVVFGILGAIAWGIIVKVTGYNLGIVAIGVGYMVSQGFIIAGRSTSSKMGIVAGIIALLSIFLGSMITILLSLGEYWGVSFVETIQNIYLHKLPGYVISSTELMDILFYFIAISAAYKRSFVDVNRLNVMIEPDELSE